jgi:hypothetical protein
MHCDDKAEDNDDPMSSLVVWEGTVDGAEEVEDSLVAWEDEQDRFAALEDCDSSAAAGGGETPVPAEDVELGNNGKGETSLIDLTAEIDSEYDMEALLKQIEED